MLGGDFLELTDRRCSVCDSNDCIRVFDQEYFSIVALDGESFSQTIVLCRNCGFAFSNPSPAPEELTRYYALFSNYENPQNNGRDSDQLVNKWKRTHEMIRANLPKSYTGRALEIGCATGTGLSMLKTQGWEVLGLEPSRTAAKLAGQMYDVEVICSPFEKDILRGRGRFDLIILSHVLEHLLSPRSILNDLRDLLTNNGLIYIEVPNLLRPYVPFGYFTFEHLNYFTPTTLTSLLNICGYSTRMELFDNSADIAPFYPVVSAIARTGADKLPGINSDFDSALDAIGRYKQASDGASRKMQSKVSQIIKNTKSGRLAIWGAGIHTSQLLSLTELSGEPVACVFDSDPKKHGKHINGIQIVGMKDPEGAAKIVDSIIISSRASEREIYGQIVYLEKYGIKIFRLYDEQG
jgi:2-polyprenyl-3-methyl-5-hydroxy-6-metoxy-1,4-benzoquinol methylase